MTEVRKNVEVLKMERDGGPINVSSLTLISNTTHDRRTKTQIEDVLLKIQYEDHYYYHRMNYADITTLRDTLDDLLERKWVGVR